MKKFLCGILLSVLLFSVTAIAGCLPKIELFTAGTYETYEMEGELFVKAKLIMQPITQEEYERADGINVIKNDSKSKENNVYYSFELFFYDKNKDKYIQAEIVDLKYSLGTPGTYICEIVYEWENELIKRSASFIYNGENYSYFYYGLKDNEQYREVKWMFHYINN